MKGNFGNACHLLKRKNALTFSNYMEIDQSSTDDPTKPAQSSLIFESNVYFNIESVIAAASSD